MIFNLHPNHMKHAKTCRSNGIPWRNGFTPLEIMQKNIFVPWRGFRRQQTRFLTGFTLIELLVTIGIISVIAALAVPAYSAMQKNMALNNAAQELADALRAARTKSLASDHGLNHGLRLIGTGYEELSNPPDTATVNTGVVHDLTGDLRILTADVDLFFQRLRGDPIVIDTEQLAGASQIEIGYDGGQRKTIAIGSNGQISLQ